jgi:hypothetical protein
MRIFSLIATLAVALAAGRAGAVTVGSINDFQDGTAQNWDGGDTLTNVPTGGPAGTGDRYLNVNSSSRLATYNSIVPWPGDYASAGVGRIDLDLRDPDATPLDMRIVLFGIDGDRWTSTLAQTVPADDLWHHYSFSLAESDLTQVQGVESYAQTFTAVERVMIRYDPDGPSAGGALFNGAFDVDNIAAGAVPEPGSTALAAAAAFGFATRRRRRARRIHATSSGAASQ